VSRRLTSHKVTENKLNLIFNYPKDQQRNCWRSCDSHCSCALRSPFAAINSTRSTAVRRNFSLSQALPEYDFSLQPLIYAETQEIGIIYRPKSVRCQHKVHHPTVAPNPLGMCAAPLDVHKGLKEESNYNIKIIVDGIAGAGKTNSKAKAEKRRMLTLMCAHKDGTAAHHLPSAISNPLRRARRHPKRYSRTFKGKAQPGNDGPWRQIAMARPENGIHSWKDWLWAREDIGAARAYLKILHGSEHNTVFGCTLATGAISRPWTSAE
jgi:hypothetical protein